MANNIITPNTLSWLVEEATDLFNGDIIKVQAEYTTRLDQLLAIINNLQRQIEYQSGINSSLIYKRHKNFSPYLTQNTNQIYVELTKIYYSIRTFLTGETIDFLENIGGELKVIQQKDWLKVLSGKNETQYGTSCSQIFLLEKDIQGLGKSIADSDNFAKIENYNKIVNDTIEAGTFKWSEDNKEPVLGQNYKDHDVYKKDSRDTNVYAYYTQGKRRLLKYLYDMEITYNLGDLQETLVGQIENAFSNGTINNLLMQLEGEHPLSILHNWEKNSIPGTVEGDFRSWTGQWIQSKRGNPVVIQTLQAHKVIVQIRQYLTQLKNAFQTNNKDILEELTEDFLVLFSSAESRQNIENNLKKMIGDRLTLLNTPILS